MKSEPKIQTELEKFLYMQSLNLHSKIQQLTSIINTLPVQAMNQPIKIQKKEESDSPSAFSLDQRAAIEREMNTRFSGARSADQQNSFRNLMSDFANLKNMMEAQLVQPKEEKFEEM